MTEEEERDFNTVMQERDHWEEKATELAVDVGKMLDFNVGEHTSANCPVQEAIDHVYWMTSKVQDALASHTEE